MGEERTRKKTLSLKEKKKIYKANKFYDDNVAGKWDPQSGYYNHTFNQKKKTSSSSKPVGVVCGFCGFAVLGKEHTVSFICSNCGKYNKR